MKLYPLTIIIVSIIALVGWWFILFLLTPDIHTLNPTLQAIERAKHLYSSFSNEISLHKPTARVRR